ncbi:high-potential iron-sulfur protein [Thiomonas intermedia]|uniref:high-potential iron-sulfur protein n=1 Tax=Thiomonas intermedia TaxID=926 RepID=UPI0009A47742|nr:high-potential iron-sulfur protein [Thiomonas intermedia]
MDNSKSPLALSNPQRRGLLRRGGLLLAVVGTAALVPAQADDGMLSKTAVHYQDGPHGGQHCSDCAYFIPGQSATDSGACRLVAGTIFPKGWCERFSS